MYCIPYKTEAYVSEFISSVIAIVAARCHA